MRNNDDAQDRSGYELVRPPKRPIVPNQPARYVEFYLTETLLTGDVSALAKIDRQPGYSDGFCDGEDPDPDDAGFSVYNRRTHTVGTYIFEGLENDRGMAIWDERCQAYRIWMMECPHA